MSTKRIYEIINKASKEERILNIDEINNISRIIINDLGNEYYVNNITIDDDPGLNYSYYDFNNFDIHIINRKCLAKAGKYLEANFKIVEDLLHEIKHAEQNMIYNEEEKNKQEYDLVKFCYDNAFLNIDPDPREENAMIYSVNNLIKITNEPNLQKSHYEILANYINYIKNSESVLNEYLRQYNNLTQKNISADAFKIVNSKNYMKKFSYGVELNEEEKDNLINRVIKY